MEFNSRLKQAMLLAGFSQTELARLSGIDLTNINHMLAGNRRPGLDNMARLLIAMPKIDARWLVTGDTLPTEEHAE